MAAITSREIVFRYTTTTGAVGDTTAGAAVTSLGKHASTTAWAGGSANDLFDDITGAENAASQVNYGGIAVLNNNNTANTLQTPVVYISAETAAGASIAVGMDSTAASAKGGASAKMLTIANDATASAGVSFSSPTTIGTELSMSNLPVAQVRGIWVQRSAANTSAASDGVTIAVTGDTGAL